jgi:hypothetical protein
MAESKIETVIVLTLTVQEAKYLKVVLQNPPRLNEPLDKIELRESLFNTLPSFERLSKA